MEVGVNLVDKEDIKFLYLILKELTTQVDRNIEVFSSNKARGTEEFEALTSTGERIGETWLGKTMVLEIAWRPSNDVNHPFKHIDKVQVKWEPHYGKMTMFLRYQSKGSGNRDTYEVVYPVGFNHQFNNDYMHVKKEFCSIFKKVEAWQSVEIPRRNKEKLINAVCEAFPSILDELLVGERDAEA